MPIIGISGKMGSGKDTVGKIIQYLSAEQKHVASYQDKFPMPYRLDEFLAGHDVYNVNYVKDYTESISEDSGWKIKKFAYKLKQIVSILTGIPIEDLEKEEVKNSYLGPEWTRYKGQREVGEKMTVRQLLQEVGTDAMRNVIHTNVWVNALLSDYKADKSNWIITDVRFPNEAAAILSKKDGYVIRVERGKINPCSAHDQHISETALDNYPHFSAKIENNGTIEELVPKVKSVLHSFKLLTN